MQSDIEKFAKAVHEVFPISNGTQKYKKCPCCNGLIHICKHTFDDQFYAICSNCKMTLRG